MSARLAGGASLAALALACGAALAGASSGSQRIALAASAASASGVAASAGDPISDAERLLFMHPHLATVRTPRTLSYAYSVRTAASASASDHATLALRPRADGTCCAVHGEYLSGAMAVSLPDFDDATANPLMLYFLEGEVRRLQRVTQGQSAHFRRQIRMSLATDATVADTTIAWNGKQVPARVVRVAPFVDDPYRARFEREAKTTYEFVISDQVPGGVAELSASLPGATGADAPIEQRRLTLQDPQPATPAQP